ncbi:MAG: PleD family two-component system response regulator [Alphaproteobacteria bacterium]
MKTGFKILIVDDDDLLAEMIEGLLSAQHFKTRRALNGKEGLKLVREFQPDAIILDRMMPEMDGNDVLKELKSSMETRHIPVIMLTAEKRLGEVEESLKLGALDYVIKPFEPETFVERVKKILFVRPKGKERPKT